MKIIVAPDSFKGSLITQEATLAMERGVRAVIPDAEIDRIPMADGGEGTTEALVDSTEGRYVEVRAADPLGRPMNGRYGILGDGKTAVIEMSAVSGLPLLRKEERNPLYTTTYGTGQLIENALESGCRDLIVGIGGSATNDCGTGMAQALGARFLTKAKTVIQEKMSGGLLGEAAYIDLSCLHPAIQDSHITVARDVENPLLGAKGCARVYSPQKGATPEVVEQLEENMRLFIDVAEKATRRSARHVPGAGAAGGLGAGLMLFLGVELRAGVDLVMDACGFTERIRGADLILTGEGKIDAQTVFGKTIAGIAVRAEAQKIPIIAFAGAVERADGLYELGVTSSFSICQGPMSLDEAMADAPMLLQNAVERVMRVYGVC